MDLDGDGSTDITNLETDDTFRGTKGGQPSGLKEAFSLRTKVCDLADNIRAK